MTGGKGNDTFIVSDVGDTVTEAGGQGDDIVFAEIASYTLTANVEMLTLDFGAVNGTGNSLNNEIVGNSEVNKLDGGSGNDAIEAGVRQDLLPAELGLTTCRARAATNTPGRRGRRDSGRVDGAWTSCSVKRIRTLLDRLDEPSELQGVASGTINGFRQGWTRSN